MSGRMNEEQQRLVEENLAVIDRVIRSCIHTNNRICGLEYDDIYQIGAIGLCKAAMSYRQMDKATFRTYAFRVVRNTLIDYLRSFRVRQEAYHQFLSEANFYMERQCEAGPDRELYEKGILQALEESKVRYSGSARKGIEAIEMKMQGYSGKDIAEKYCVNTNYITACISRAQKYLKKDDAFLRMIA